MTERRFLNLILALVGIAAGFVSFTHVHDWTMAHVPAGTPDAFGWVNAVISELGPIAAALEIRRRRALGVSIRFPVFLLLAFASLSLAAQLAVAQPSVSGWLLSAVPALAFMLLVKLVLGQLSDSAPTATPAAAPLIVQTLPAMRQAPVMPVGVSTLPIAPARPVANFSAGVRAAWVTAPAGASMLPLIPRHRPRPARTHASATNRAPRRAAASETRRPRMETAARARAILAERPKTTQVALAQELGISRRTLRDALAAAA